MAAIRRTRKKGNTKDSEAAKRKILAAAIRLFGEHGFATTSAERVAEEAGYSQATLFFHFKTKQGLLQACLDQALTGPLANPAAGVEAESVDTLTALKRIDDLFEDNVTARFYARMLNELPQDKKVGPLYTRLHQAIRQTFSDSLQRETGASDSHAEFAAAALLSMMVGIHVEYGLEHTRFSREDYRKMLLLVANLLIENLRKT